ncbi:MAG: translation elongation factor 4 [Spirochaetia bacterium]|nr:translation elongation factor 4 [Spirochaetota bacterium]MDW8112644.1 translation elongation factor 4 [Spirochaetia bacterium]
MIDLKKIRNFSIIAHIDHGKSTLADRLLEIGGVKERTNDDAPALDFMPVEREHGITVKAQSATFLYTSKDGNTYIFNLIDTPGHVDFNFEVRRSLKACEGVLLLVDATQGVQAQTLTNFLLAFEEGLEIVPVINKIDLPSADIEATKREIEKELGIPSDDAILVSAKEGIGIETLMEEIIRRIPPPKGNINAPLKALVFDSFYDNYKGVVAKIRVFDGSVKPGDEILFMGGQKKYKVEEVGTMALKFIKKDELTAGEVGYLIGNIKSISDFTVGDTITSASNPTAEPLPGYREPKPMVYACIFPTENEDFNELKEVMYKLKLTDASITFEPINSASMGMGFKCGFLGLLHMQIVMERLDTEFGVSVVSTIPTVKYKINMKDGSTLYVENTMEMPELSRIDSIEEPFTLVSVITPEEYIGSVMEIIRNKRGEQKSMHYIDTKRVELKYEMPLSEVIYGFFDRLKSVSSGYASMDYEFIGYRESDIVKLDILVNGKPVDALSFLVHRDSAQIRGRELVKKLQKLIPKHLFPIAIQAAIGSKVIAREDISALRKDVTAKCYGGDVTRKRKLLEKQKEGKKRLKMVGTVSIPQEAFLEVMKINQ